MKTLPTAGSGRSILLKKLLLGIVIIGLLFAALILTYKSWRYATLLSREDFLAVETQMDAVYVGTGVAGVDKAKRCYHYQDSKDDSKILKCSISMAGYVDAKNADDLASIAEKFAGQLRPLSKSDEIWNRPSNSMASPFRSGVISVKGGELNMGCLVYVKTGNDAADLGADLPRRDVVGKAALILQCGGGSREAYFETR